ncbi:MAG: serine/threonine protein kinase [Armatimonadetes bacterium]|nr:serine/threonine protein kinase [Armatimonadota bacterium]
MLHPGKVLQNRYRVEALLGKGGMGNVYLAVHVRLKRPVALKELVRITDNLHKQRQFEEQFETEAQILANLSHPNLAGVTDYFIDDGNHYLVMEFIEGRTLTQIVELAPKNISERRVLQWASQLLDVLEYLHGQNPPVIVRDLKPDNVMLHSGDQRLRLIDFGIAKRAQPGTGTIPIVKGVGTAEYAPLEQYGDSNTDQRSDLYSLGGTLLYLLTGKAPVPAWKRGQDGAVLHDPREVNPTVSDHTWSVIQQMMKLRAGDRPGSAAEVQALLKLAPPQTRPPVTSV